MASMSLIPFYPHEGREIVLRHRNAIVVRDPTSQRLEIRGLTECPTCHRPLRPGASPDRGRAYDVDDRPRSSAGGGGNSNSIGDGSSSSNFHRHHEGYVDPNYFRMLQAGHAIEQRHGAQPGPTSPLRRLFRSLGSPGAKSDADEDAGSAGGDGGSSSSYLYGANDNNNDSNDSADDYGSPPPNESRIRKEAFSPNYFKTFFVEERELGRGGKGVVLLVRHEIDGCQLGHFACKRVPVGNDHAWLEKVLVEVELLAKLSHPNLVSYRHVWLENVTLNRFGPSVACAFILQQYCNGGDLQHYVIGDQPKEATKEELKAQMRRRSKGGQGERPSLANLFAPPTGQRQLQLDEIYSLFKDITSGLAYLHAANYIHRDLKPSNCLLHREGRILTCLISDFGEVQLENAVRKSTGTTGTISYCAPEVLQLDGNGLYNNFTTKSDVFSLGMILYFMCFGRLPYQSANAINEELEDVDELRAEITAWTGFQYERRERPDLPPQLYQLLSKMLSANPAERPGASEVLQVMRATESGGGLDGFARGGTSTAAGMGGVNVGAMSPNIGLSSRRIQNLDSPIPGTPVPDPVKQQHHESNLSSVSSQVDDFDDDADAYSESPFHHNSFRKHRPSTTLTLARSHSKSPERLRRGSISSTISVRHNGRGMSPTGIGGGNTTLSPSSPLNNNGHTSASLPSSPHLHHHRSLSHHHHQHQLPSPTPLLMAPPTTFSGEVHHQWLLAQHRAMLYTRRNGESMAFLFRTALFLVKMVSLTKPCWPFMVRWGIGASLVAVAALDLGVPGSRSGGSDSNRISVPRSPQLQQRHPLWSRWDWRVSLMLLALHFVVLGVASRSDALCVGTRETWPEW